MHDLHIARAVRALQACADAAQRRDAAARRRQFWALNCAIAQLSAHEDRELRETLLALRAIIESERDDERP